MKKLTAILVDDMPNALEMLANDIAENHTEIAIIGTAISVVSAAKLLQKKQPNFDPRNYGFPKLTPLIKSISNFEIDHRETSKGNRNIKLIYVRNK